MIYKNSKEISGIFKSSISGTALYKGIKLVWEAIKSCFGNGYWVNEKPWSNTDAWRN